MEIILYYGEKLYFIWKFSSGNTDIISFFFQPQRTCTENVCYYEPLFGF